MHATELLVSRRVRGVRPLNPSSAAVKDVSTRCHKGCPRAHAAAYNIFNVQRHLTSAQSHRVLRAAAMTTWREVVSAA